MRSQEVRTRRGAPGALGPACASAASERAASARSGPHACPGVGDLRGQGSRRPDRGRGDTRGPLETLFPTHALLGCPETPPALLRPCVCVCGEEVRFSPQLAGEPWPTPFANPPSQWLKLQRHSEPLRERPVPASPTCPALPGARGAGRRPRAPARPAGPGLQPLRCAFASPAGGGLGAVWAAAQPPLSWAPPGSEAWGGGSAGPGLGGRHRGPRPRAIWMPGARAFEVVRGSLCSPGLSGSGPGGGLRLRCL